MATVAINDIVTTIGVDLGKNVFHIVGMNARGAIVLKERLSRPKIARRLTNMTSCLIGMEAYAGAHHVGRQLAALGHDVRLIPAKYVRPFLKGHKNDYRDAEAIAEAVQRPTMRFVAVKSTEQLDLQAVHRVRSRLVGQRTAVINQIRAASFLSMASQYDKDQPACAGRSPRFWHSAPLNFRHSFCGCLRTSLTIGAGSMDGLKT